MKGKIIVVFLCMVMFGACNQVQPNEGARIALAESKEQSILPSTNEIDAEGKENRTDHVEPTPTVQLNIPTVQDSTFTASLGFGEVEYTINSLSTYDSWDDAGISEEMLAYQKQLGIGDKILLASITVENISVPSDNQFARDAAINCFNLMSAKELKSDHPVGTVPIYFDNPYYENGVISETRYFQYELPSMGNSTNVVLGWILYSDEVESAEEEGVFLLYTISGKIISLEGYYNG